LGDSSANDADDVSSTVGLRRFLSSYAALGSVATEAAGPSDLASLLEKLHPMLQRSGANTPATRPAPAVSVDQLAAILASLREPMRRSRARGDFLQVWTVAGVGRNEVRNAAILAWLFDPRGSHGLGSCILHGFFLAAAGQAPTWPLHDADLTRVTVRTEECPLGTDRDRVDISIDGPDFVVFVEVKIDANEGHCQLPRYAETAGNKARAWRKKHACVIYLSPRPPTSHEPGVIVLNWRHVAQVLSGVAATGICHDLVQQYAVHIRSFF
jgi:hypothetical protein